MLWGSGNSVYGTAGVYLNPSTDYVTAVSYNASDWFRSSGATGWYNSSYAVGIYATDGTWVRTYNNAQFYSSTIIQAGASVRGPIFYDSDDTGYYLNPAGNSYLYSARIVNDITTEGGQGRFGGWYTGTGYTGAAVEVGFSGGNGNVISYNRISSAYQPLYIAGSNLYLQQQGGLVYINSQLVRQAAGQGWLSGGYGSAESTTTTGAIYSIGGSYYPTSSSLNNMYGIGYTYANVAGLGASSAWGLYVASAGTTRIFLDSDNGIGTATGSWRAPIFYDSANTAYYLDPNSTSNLRGLTTDGLTIMGGQIYVSSVNSNTLNSGYGAASDGADIWINYRGYNDAQSYYRNFNVGDGRGTNIIWAQGSSRYVSINNGQSASYTLHVNGTAYASSDMRAPIFYDSNNTGYYLDPASTSKVNQIQFANSSNNTIIGGGVSDWGVLFSNDAGWIRIGPANGSYAHIYTNMGNFYFNVDTLYANGNVMLTAANYSSYAIGYTNLGDSFGLNDNRLYLRTKGDTNHYLWNAGDDWEELGAYAGTGFRVTSNNGANGVLYVYGSSNGGYTYSPYSFRAPIFYDSDDTGYYFNGAGGSNLNYLNVNGTWGSNPLGPGTPQLVVTGTYASMYHTATNGSLGYWLHHIAGDGTYMIYGGRGAVNGTDWNWSMRAWPNQDGSYVEFRTSARAPIFYDSDNTGYYLNPASDSRLYQTLTNITRFGVDTNKGYAAGYGTYSSELHKIAFISFDWDAQYDTYYYHGIASTNIDASFGDAVSINSYNDVTIRLDTNNNNNNSYLRISDNTSGNGTFAWIGRESGVGAMYLEGRLTISNGNDSGTMYGPNASWSAYLYVGAASNKNSSYTAQVISTDGNLHLDSGTASKEIYMNYYSGQAIRMHGATKFYNTSYYSNNILSGLGNIYFDGNYGYGMVGLYNSTIFQGIFAMGDSYKLTAGGGMNNLYGLTWSHPNAGGQAGYLDSHGLIVAVNGLCYSAISNSIWARGNITANGNMYANTYYMAGNTAKYIQNFAGSHTAIYIGGSQSGYSGFTVDGGMRVMVHTAGVGAPCGFYHESQGWSSLFYVNGTSSLFWAATEKISTQSYGIYVTGEVRASSDITAYYSDIRLKKDIDVIENAVEKIKQLRGVTYTWNEEEVNVVKNRSGQRDIGLIAQEVEAIEPLFTKEYQTPLDEAPKNPEDAVNYTPRMSETYKTIKYDKLVALLVEGMKEQQLQIEELKTEIEELKAQK